MGIEVMSYTQQKDRKAFCSALIAARVESAQAKNWIDLAMQDRKEQSGTSELKAFPPEMRLIDD